MQNVAPAKLGLAVSALGISIALEYSLNFLKNILTEKGFHQNDFSSIVGLSKKKVEANGEESEVMKKAKKRIIQSMIFAVACVGGSFILSRYGSRMSRPIQKQIEGWANWLDFDHKKIVNGLTGKITRQSDLGRNHLKVLMPFAILSYWDAARDGLERIEAGCRATITGGYIGFIQPAAAKWFNQWYGQKFAHLNIMAGKFRERVKTLAVIQAESIKEAEQHFAKLGINVSPSSINRKAAELLRPKLRAKTQLFFIPFLFGILVIGLFTALMNQIWTKYRFRKAMRQALQNSTI